MKCPPTFQLFIIVALLRLALRALKALTVDGALPVVAMQVNVVLEVDERGDQRLGIGEEAFDFFGLGLGVGVEVEINLLLCI